MTACMTPVLNRARSSSHITRNFTGSNLPTPSTNPRQRVADEHVYHTSTAELGVHYDHTCGLFADLPDNLGLFATLNASQRLERGVRCFRSDDGEELAFVGDVEWVYPQDLARPVDDVPDREPLLPERDPVPRVAGELVEDRPHPAACGVAHEAQPRPRGILECSDQRGERPGVRKYLGLQLQVSARDQDGRPVVAQSSGAEDPVPRPHGGGGEGELRICGSYAGGYYVEPVPLAALDHFGIPSGDCDPGPPGGGRHRLHLMGQHLGLEPLLDDEGGGESDRSRPRDCQVVDRPVDRELSD